MFLHYYVDTQTQHNKREVHHEGCSKMPPMSHRQYLGMFESCEKATAMAKVVYTNASNCPACTKVHVTKKARAKR